MPYASWYRRSERKVQRIFAEMHESGSDFAEDACLLGAHPVLHAEQTLRSLADAIETGGGG